MSEQLQMLRILNPLREPVLRAAVGALHLPPGSRGLDAGCGIGQQALLLAVAVGPVGRVVGLDWEAELLEGAEEIVRMGGLAQRISFYQGDVNQLPWAENSFDWAWSVDCVGYAPFAPLPAVRELVRVVKPGGIVALLAWSSERLLPGFPLLEARLAATTSGLAPFARDTRPEYHFHRALGWLQRAGLAELAADTFAGTAHAPLSPDLCRALTALLQMRWSGAAGEVTAAEWATFCRLTQPNSADFVLNRSDYYAFFTYSMFRGTVKG